MKTLLATVTLGLVLALSGAELAAHHSFAAQFDGNKPITLRGTVTSMLWSNPHGHLYVDVKMPDGKVVNWEIEFGAPAQLYRRGWRKEDLAVGTVLIVQGFLARDGSPTANANTVKLADGRELFAGSPGTGAPNEGAGEGRGRQ